MRPGSRPVTVGSLLAFARMYYFEFDYLLRSFSINGLLAPDTKVPFTQ